MDDHGKVTVVLGATPNPSRYAYLAVHRLVNHGHEVVPIGIKKGEVAGIKIINEKPPVQHVDTVTLYLNPQNQKQYYEYILGLHPKRIIFNPGTENSELQKLAGEKGIESLEACTLVLLSTGQY